ncbi:hypothetical protein FQR65_LT18586 [Abscondita terminalis]|nr:hypothetical protein FQR65_LT18586 [Abscondita terminalis]
MFGINQIIKQNLNNIFVIFTRSISVLVIAEHNIKHISPTTQIILAAARKISDNVVVLLPGPANSTIAKYISTRKGVSKVLTAENVNNDGYPEENFTSTILATHKKYNFSHIIGVSSKLGKSVLPRVAAKLDVPALSNIISVKTPDTFVRSIYAGNAVMTVKVMDPVKVVMIKEMYGSSGCRVIAEHNIKHISPTTQIILAAARKISDNVVVLLPGPANSTIAKYISTRKGVSKVLTAENVNNDGYPEENFTSTILATHKKYNFSHIIGVSSKLGKSVLPRVAAKLDVPALSNIISVKTPDTFVRSIYAGNAVMTVKVMDPVKVVMIKEMYGSSGCREDSDGDSESSDNANLNDFTEN